MESFYIIVLSVALLLLIVILTYIGIKMGDKTSNVSVYPPSSQPCPDYWLQSANPTNLGCVIPPTGQTNTSAALNSSNTPGYNNGVINFGDQKWSNNGATSTCNQLAWANKNSIQWDGVSNFSGC